MEEEKTGEGTVLINPRAEAIVIDTGAPDAAKLVMLGVIFLIMLGLLGLILRFRYLARHPMREVTDLETLSRDEPEE